MHDVNNKMKLRCKHDVGRALKQKLLLRKIVKLLQEMKIVS